MTDTSQGTEQALSFSSPQEEALLNLMRSADCLHRALQHLLRPSGLTSTQYNVLRILRGARPNGLTCSSIGRRMITPEPDITRLLGRLKAQKFIRQQRDVTDRRVLWTHITEEGLVLLGSLDELIDQAPKDLLRGIGREELRELTRLLKKIRSCDADKTAPDKSEAVNTQVVNSEIVTEQIAVTGKRPSPLPLRSRPHPE
jgi:DNA-binding MarR family transcriptional regulator